MIEYAIVSLVAFLASMLTFFSGFGLGTMLTPVLVIFFPGEIAVAATAIVHFLNNLFKLSLVGRHAKLGVVMKFGIPAMVGALGGAWLLTRLAQSDVAVSYSLLMDFETTALNLVLAALIFFFALFELIPKLKHMEFGERWMLPGGILSGFFGGLSGHQGALRSAFLLKFPLSKEQFIATGVVIACLVDTIRISTYASSFDFSALNQWGLVASATLAAFAGAFVGKRLLKKITISFIQVAVGILMMSISILMILGYI